MQDHEAQQPATAGAPPVPAGSFVFGPRPVAVTSALIAVACLGTLVIVGTQKNVDALSTIALALAILAFAAQLIIYIAQANNASQQLYLSQVVQAQTARMLAGIQATAEAQQEALDRIIPRLVSTTVAADTADEPEAADPAALEKARSQFEELTRRLNAIVREELAKAQPSYPTLGGTAVLPSGTAMFHRRDAAPYIVDRSAAASYLRPLREAGIRAGFRDPDPAAPKLDDTGGEPFTFSKGTEDRSSIREDPAIVSEPRPPSDPGDDS